MRWDHYTKFGDNNIHLANMFYAFAMIAALMICLAGFMTYSVNKDFKNIELLNNRRKEKRDQRRFGENNEDEMGLASGKPKNVTSKDVAWKKLQGDVFRKPEYPVLMCAMAGMGVQVAISVFFLLVSLTLGFLAP